MYFVMDLSSYKELWCEFKKYLTLQIDYVKLTAIEKLTILLAAMTFVGVVIVLLACAFFFLTVAFVEWLDTVINCTWAANLITCGIVLFLLLMIVCLKKVLIINPVTKFVTKLFLNPPKQ